MTVKPSLHHLLTAILLLTALGAARAQESVLSAANNASSEQGTVTYSVGQVAWTTDQGSAGIITQGVQQPYEILFMEGLDDIGISLKCIVFPNPADDFVILKKEDLTRSGLHCRLTDLKGTLILEVETDQKETKIGMEEQAPGVYFLTVSDKGKSLQTYRIIKK